MPTPSEAAYSPPSALACDVTRARFTPDGVQLQFGQRDTGPLLQVGLSRTTAQRLRDALAQALRSTPPSR